MCNMFRNAWLFRMCKMFRNAWLLKMCKMFRNVWLQSKSLLKVWLIQLKHFGLYGKRLLARAAARPARSRLGAPLLVALGKLRRNVRRTVIRIRDCYHTLWSPTKDSVGFSAPYLENVISKYVHAHRPISPSLGR